MQELIIEDQITFLYCSDLKVTGSFYEDIMGFPLVIDQGSCHVVRVSERGGGYLGFCERLETQVKIGGIIFTMTVGGKREVDDWYAYLLKKGVDIPDLPKDNLKYEIYHFFFRDPDGYMLEIQAFHDPDWRDFS